VWQEALGKLKKFIHFIGSRTRDLPAPSIVPQPLRCNKISLIALHVSDLPLNSLSNEPPAITKQSWIRLAPLKALPPFKTFKSVISYEEEVGALALSICLTPWLWSASELY
jgi:hypothetical protein